MKRLLACVFSAVFAGLTFAEDAEIDYITGAECEIKADSSDANKKVLTITSGDGQLVASMPGEVQHLWINVGASLKVMCDDPFNTKSRCVIHLFGTLDLNGRSTEALRLDNKPDSSDIGTARRVFEAKLINSAPNEVNLRLTSSSDGYFYGAIDDTITISSANKPICIMGPTGSARLPSLTVTGQVFPVSTWTRFRFVLHPPEGAKYPLGLSELVMTYQGKQVPCNYTTSSKLSGSQNNWLGDAASGTYWAADDGDLTADQTNDLAYGSTPLKVDGYRIAPYEPGNSPTTVFPASWELYGYRDTLGWVLLDSRSGVGYPSRKGSSWTNFLFSAVNQLGNPFGTNTTLVVDGTGEAAARVSLIDPLVVGKVTGAGTIRLEDGSVIGPTDFSEYTGSFTASGCDTPERQAQVALSAEFGEEQQVSVATPQNIAIVNAATGTVSVLIDDNRADQHLFGKLADGAIGKLGLVKRGAGERILETEDASYTGPTKVEAGTLTVARARKSYSAQYFRITPLAVVATGTDRDGFNWSMNEFQLLDADGNAIDWPKTPTCAQAQGTGHTTLKNIVDGDVTSRALVANNPSNPSAFPQVIINAQKKIEFHSYRWYSPHNNSADKGRTPIRWRLEISDDKSNWTVCDESSWGWTAADDANAGSSDKWIGANSVPRGPFALGPADATGTGLRTLDSAFLVPDGARASHGKLKARYFRLKVFETADPEGVYYGTSENRFGWELAELSLMKDGQRVPWPAGVQVLVYGASVNSNNGSALAKICNNVIAPVDDVAERCFIMDFPSCVSIDAGEDLEFDAYSFVSTQNSNSYFKSRVPKVWDFQITSEENIADKVQWHKADRNTWFTIDQVGHYTPGVDYTITKAYQEHGPFPVADKYPLLDRGVGDSIGDRSPVSIAEGATLKLATDYEQFGPLSGAGTLDLELNAVGEINACADATFSGAVTGSGTLAVTGEAVQSFEGADLSGVKTLELNGGAIAGTASFGGNDLTLAFDGGALGATLSGIGTLTVTGKPKLFVDSEKLPASRYSARLITAESIDEGTQAALKTADVNGLPRGWAYEIHVNGTSVSIDAWKLGMTVILK